ncbi:hypothetical protein GCM10027034_08110 [Ramlibacter solisilvae]|uniref:non-specific serine/threonine protein kinase n=1 Tax=Ramlibacter tataouinensis TaxID=94132 RepID=A0A127JY57_9BURK|nr:serine/threonine-protein kinase [Ramlibacter tataouinensis]AMO24825.1 hypothetical protein UC35_20775 [Ramlibacter tataouinensis]
MSLKKLGRYELVRVLGKGAMGVVYEGRDPNLDRRVAIKTVKVDGLSEEAAAEYEARFRTEARSAARLQHPNIVSVYDSDRDADIAFLVMEYIQGDDLKHHLDQGVRYSLEQALKMVRDLLSALDYAHRQGIVHRDIKPANLLLEGGGRVKLTDFGVARIQDSGEATRTQGSMIGTLKYMAPEQVQGQKIDSRADLFSVGVVLYQLLTDKRPFDGDNDFSIIHQIIGHNPPPPSTINPRLPAAIDAVVSRALAKDREQRFATARDFASALQSAIRRAEDATVVPPADPFKKADAGGTGSKSQSIAVATTPSVVTQEVELVYWKDIKDSTDPEEFEAFLEKFPAGIYADLARRRLRKLNGGNTSTDQTVLTGTTAAQGGTNGAQDLEATLLLSTGTAAQSSAPDPTAAPASHPEPEASGTPVMLAEPAREASSLATEEQKEPIQDQQEPRRGPASKPAPLATAKKRPIAVLAGAGALLVAGLVLFMTTGKGPDSQAQAGAPAAAPVAVTEPPSASPAAAAASDLKPVIAAPAASAAQAKASTPVRAVVAAKAKGASAVAPVVEAPRPSPAPAAAHPETRVAAAPAPAPAGPNPVDACKDKMFLTREFCLAEACEKPAARSHPMCVSWREDKRLREESKVRQSPQ